MLLVCRAVSEATTGLISDCLKSTFCDCLTSPQAVHRPGPYSSWNPGLPLISQGGSASSRGYRPRPLQPSRTAQRYVSTAPPSKSDTEPLTLDNKPHEELRSAGPHSLRSTRRSLRDSGASSQAHTLRHNEL